MPDTDSNPSHVTLVVTGSVAAIKTGQLATALKEQGFAVDYHVTDSAWPFVESTGKYKLTPEQLAEIKAAPARGSADITLVAPASADYISKLANGEITPSGKLYIAPAMNFMMWQHPATQANVKKLMAQGARFLGPALGGMACRDYGFGRFADPQDIAAALKDDAHALHQAIKPAVFNHPTLPTATKKDAKKILLVVHENPAAAKEAIADLQAKGYEVKCAAAPGVDTTGFGVETCTEHYQLHTDPPGMEHIRMPEWADAVLVYPSNPAYAQEMEKGGAASFPGCVYLASKAPVFMVSQDAHPELEKHGVRMMGSYQQFEQELNMAAQELTGKHFLILGGTPRERVDSFRFYANNKRPENHGAQVAEALKALGASVTFICPEHSPSKPDGAITTIDGKNIAAAADMVAAAARLTGQFDGVLQLANISQMKCPRPVGHKISKTSAEAPNLFEVVGNVDITDALHRQFPDSPLTGYGTYQEPIDAPSDQLPASVTQACQRYETKPEQVDTPPKAQHTKSKAPRIVISTSRTEEALTDDGVIITNAFSGRQGQALATSFANKGWDVTLISGPTDLPDLEHENVRNVHITLMDEMLKATQRELARPMNAYISAAAIADFSVDTPLTVRLKPDEPHTLVMKENASVVGSVTKSSNRPNAVVSFAAQSPSTILEYATSKFAKLGVDLTVANPIGDGTPAAKDPTQNKVFFVTGEGVEELPVMSKQEVANHIANKVEQIELQARQKTTGAA